jgi:hypothetical protein
MFEIVPFFEHMHLKFAKSIKLDLSNVQAMENIMSSSCVIFRPKVSTDADWTSIFATGATGCFAKTRQAKEYLFEFIFTKTVQSSI